MTFSFYLIIITAVIYVFITTKIKNFLFLFRFTHDDFLLKIIKIEIESVFYNNKVIVL